MRIEAPDAAHVRWMTRRQDYRWHSGQVVGFIRKQADIHGFRVRKWNEHAGAYRRYPFAATDSGGTLGSGHFAEPQSASEAGEAADHNCVITGKQCRHYAITQTVSAMEEANWLPGATHRRPRQGSMGMRAPRHQASRAGRAVVTLSLTRRRGTSAICRRWCRRRNSELLFDFASLSSRAIRPQDCHSWGNILTMYSVMVSASFCK
jgi:hypothetical protein